MSRPYEALLADRVTRLDVLIAQSEELFARTNDDKTRHNLAAELARQRELREQSISVLQRTVPLNRIVARSHVCFWISFALLTAIAIATPSGMALGLLVLIDLLLLIVSAAVFLVTLILRDVVARGYQPWRFQLRTVFLIMTVVAVCLTFLVLAFRNWGGPA